ncbi:MFS transporter [Arthrobacter sp. ISL-30]|uniref:MFS transporter n=1 Tax=Arthrobacter sp. ISL-30 TaxID=2819109 RepID=UPI001BECB0E1|nr:MFS transporter [Arthrobacter sp. ISL-30]MBT2514726.1 MFS transporter [Arthrobacter sp. ISL-30]
MLLNLAREFLLRPNPSPRGWDAPPAVRIVLAALVVGLLPLGTNLMTPLFPVFQERMMLGNGAVTAAFVAYVLPVVIGLPLFGHWSEYMGRRVVLVASLGLGILAAVVLLLASGLPELLAGRALHGLAVALSFGAGAAALRDLLPGEPGLCARITLLASVGGGAAGPLVGGWLSELGDPIGVPFSVYLLAVVVVLVMLAAVRANPPVLDPPPRGFFGSLRPPRPSLPRSIFRTFFLTSGVGFLSFAVFGFFLSVAPAFYAPMLGGSRIMGGLSGALVLGGSACAQLVPVRGRHKAAISLMVMAGGLVLVVVSQIQQLRGLLFIAATLTGLSQGIGFRTLFAGLNSELPLGTAARTVSLMYVVTYLGSALPVLGLGLAMDFWGATVGVNTFLLGASGAALFFAAICLIYRRSTRVND